MIIFQRTPPASCSDSLTNMYVKINDFGGALNVHIN